MHTRTISTPATCTTTILDQRFRGVLVRLISAAVSAAEGEVAVDSIGAQAISRAQLEVNFNFLPST